MLKEYTPKATYINILGSDGTLRKEVEETTPGAVKREWKSGDGKSSGVKWEHIYSELSGVISSVEIYEGDFGKNIIVGVTDGEEPEIKLSISMNSPFGEDFAKKLPNIDIKKPIIIKPYAFTDDKGKVRKGVTVMQDGNKLQNFFYDAAKKENIHEFPNPQYKFDKKGEKKDFSKDEWKIYFALCRQFLIDYIEEHHLLKNESTSSATDGREMMYEKMGVKEATDEQLDSIPF
jgi:hypothetical protein